ncbi:MAG: bifunctional glutamate N-acetyltransferase/amino-acid acetyltransferase ArgJ [Candidatus Omnitrophica bacterium]|nr:bifunctional glutamate N-acetyltransferase/amino-acid acetyltransferase ArgJ [Candidatus Omnitrophota bacterium]
MKLKSIPGGVTAAKGFRASGVAAGIKVRGKRDLALIYSQSPAVAAGMLTTNQLAAAPIRCCKTIFKRGKAQAIIANSGNANACTGIQGMIDAQGMAQAAAKALSLDPRMMLVASTGVIGRPLPIRKILEGIPSAVTHLNAHGSHAAAEAIMTTDLVPKEYAVEFSVEGAPVRIGGIAKGSGMIHPTMATMFAFLTTDAAITLPSLRVAVKQAVAHSFNSITVDGDMSTNDIVAVLANGRAGNKALQAGDAGLGAFVRALTHVCEHLAKMIVKDGEGATHLITVDVRGAHSAHEARKAARGVAGSLLVKTMVTGRDPNWGRVAAAIGASGAHLNPGKLTISLGGITVFQHGQPVRFNPLHLKRVLDHPETLISIHLGAGASQGHVWTCNLTEGYIHINAKYTT